MTQDKETDGLGLGKITGLSLSAFLEPHEEKFRDIPLDLIREDDENPRQTFEPATLNELAATIRVRGVITPISVRPDPEREGSYIVNHGHRRLKASRLAGRDTIPAVIDKGFRDEDRIIENIQRDNLAMHDVARFIAGKMAQGMKQKEIAVLIGKSAAYVSNYVQLLELPPQTGKALQEGRLSDLTAINELAKAEKRHPEEVRDFLAHRTEVSRSAAQQFRSSLCITPDKKDSPQKRSGATDKKDARPIRAASSGKAPGPYGPDAQLLTDGWGGGRVMVECGGRRGHMLLKRRPSDESRVWICYDDGRESEEPLKKLRLVAIVER